MWWMAENLKYEVEGAEAVYYGPYSGGDTTELDGFAYDWLRLWDLTPRSWN